MRAVYNNKQQQQQHMHAQTDALLKQTAFSWLTCFFQCSARMFEFLSTCRAASHVLDVKL